MSLDTNVYKIPSFSKMGYEVARKERKELERDLGTKEAEKSFNAAQNAFTGGLKQDLELAWESFSTASKQAEKTGSEEDRKVAMQKKAMLDGILTAGSTQIDNANKQYQTARSVEFQGYADSPENISGNYTKFVNRNWESKLDQNGNLMVKEGDQFVPWNKSSVYSAQVNDNNSFLIPKKIEEGKFVYPDSFLQNMSGAIKNAASKEEANQLLEDEFEYMMKTNKAFFSDVMVHYEIADRKTIDGKQGLSMNDIRSAENRAMTDEKYLQRATESYLSDMKERLGMFDAKEGLGGTQSFNQTFKLDGQEIEGEFYVLPDGKKVGDISAIGFDEDGDYYVRQDLGSGMSTVRKASDADVAMVQEKLGINISRLQKEDNKESVKAEEPAKAEEVSSDPELDNLFSDIKTETSTDSDRLGLGVAPAANTETTMNPQTGVAPPVGSEYMLPDTFYENLLDYEGGISTKESDLAYDANPDAPMYNGKRAHTNKGVQYKVFKTWAKESGIPESKWKERFLSLSDKDTLQIVDGFTKRSGADNFESPVLRSLFTQNAWGTGKVWAADFKKGRSKEYRALLDWLQGETGLDFKNTGKITAEEAKAIEKVFQENPEGFVNEFIDKKKTYFTSLGENYKANGKGWNKRAEDLRSRMLAQVS